MTLLQAVISPFNIKKALHGMTGLEKFAAGLVYVPTLFMWYGYYMWKSDIYKTKYAKRGKNE